MEPVQIDFMYGGNTETEGAKIEKSLDDITTASKKAQADVVASAKEQASVIKQIEADIKSLEKQIGKAAPGNSQQALIQELAYAKRALEEEKAALNSVNESIDTTASAHVRLRTRVMEAKDELAKMEMAGKRGTPEYQAMAKNLGELADQMSDTTAQTRILADDEKGFKGVASAVSGVAGALSAGVGAAALFGAEQEDLVKIQTRLQAVMAITIGIQQVAEMLNKDSYFSVVLLTKAKNMWAVANLRVATTLGITTVQAQILMATLTLGLSVAIIGLVSVFSTLIEKQQVAVKSAKEFSDKTAESVAKPILELKKLSNEWSSLGNNMQEKQTYIDKNKEAFKSLGIEINNVADAEALLSSPQRLRAFQESIMAKAKAAAAMEIATEKYKESLKKQAEADKLKDTINVQMTGGAGTGGYSVSGSSATINNSTKSNLRKEQQTLLKEGDSFFKIMDDQNKIGAQKLAESGVKSIGIVIAGSVEAIEAAIAIKKEALKKVTNRADYEKIDNEIKALQKKEAAITGGKNEKVTKNTYDAEKALQKSLLEIHDQTSKLLLDQQADSLQKRLNAVDLEKQLEVQKIQEKEVAIIAAYNKSHKDDKGFKPLSSSADTYNEAHKDDKGFVPKTNADVITTSLTTIDTSKDKALMKQRNAEFHALDKAYADRRTEETTKWGEELTALAMQFADERIQIEDKCNKDIVKLADNPEAITAAKTERDKKISTVTAGMLQEMDVYKLATNDQLQISKATTEKLIADIKARIEAAVTASDITKRLSREDADRMLADINKAQKTVAGNKTQNNPFAQLGNAISGSHTANKNLSDFKSDFAAGKIDPATADQQLAGLEDAAAKATSSMAGAAGAALQGVQGILNSVVGGLDQLGLLNEQEKKDAQDVIGMVGGAADIAMGIASGNPVQIITGSISLLTSAFSLFDKKGKDIAKKQKAIEANLNDLTAAYKRLQKAVEDALGTDVYKGQRESIKNLQAQIRANEEWIGQEYRKKKKKQNQDAIADRKAEIEALQNEIADTANAIVESLAQTNAKDLASQLGDALITAFANGEDAAVAMGNVVNDVIKNAVSHALKLQFLEKPMQKAVEQLAADMESGNELTATEQSNFEKKIQDAGKLYYEQLSKYSNIFTGDATATQTGIKGDTAKMTDETGTALTGQIIAMRLNIVAILATNKNAVDVMSRMLAIQEDIRTNTSFCRKLERIDETLYYLKLNGIKVE